jgi:hypothetical protein
MTLRQFYPQNNPLNFIPMASFGGVPAAADIGWDGRFPMHGADTTFNFSDNFSWIRATHSLKFGIFADRGREYEGEDGTFAGNFSFARDVNNPLDANYATPMPSWVTITPTWSPRRGRATTDATRFCNGSLRTPGG